MRYQPHTLLLELCERRYTYTDMISVQHRSYEKKESVLNHSSKNLIKKPKKIKLHQQPILCPICGNAEAGNHLHYGGRGCSSCRAFFRRSVQNESYTVSSLTTILICKQILP